RLGGGARAGSHDGSDAVAGGLVDAARGAAAGWRERDGVVDEIRHRPVDLHAVDFDRRQARSTRELELDLVVLRRRDRPSDRLADERRQIGHDRMDLEPTGLYAVRVQKIEREREDLVKAGLYQ